MPTSPLPAHPDIAILMDGFLKNWSKNGEKSTRCIYYIKLKWVNASTISAKTAESMTEML